MLQPLARIVTFSLLISLVQQPLLAETFRAPIDQSRWKTKTNKLECTLTHTIPGYGEAVFSQSSGEGQRFVLESILGRLTPGKAKLMVTPPKWKYDNDSRLLANIDVVPGKMPITLSKTTVYQLLENMRLGLTPQFVMKPANTALSKNSHDKDKVVLSLVGFQKPYQDYLKCIDNMVPHSFAELKEIVLYFESGSAILSHEDEAKLNELAAFIRADGKIRRIDVLGYADSKGGYQTNLYLTNLRTWAVKDYMVMHKQIPMDLFRLKGYAESSPVATNKTKEGRAKNRRVIIKLYR